VSRQKYQKWALGAVVRIPLDDTRHCYGQLLRDVDVAVFDTLTTEEMAPEEVITRPVLFRVAVSRWAVTQVRWEKVGRAAVRGDLYRPIPKFVQDALHPERFSIYLGGEDRPASREECEGLECCAVWEPEHVEDRIRDHYAGVPCKWVRLLALPDRQEQP
jgi:hypothetical protein